MVLHGSETFQMGKPPHANGLTNFPVRAHPKPCVLTCAHPYLGISKVPSTFTLGGFKKCNN